MGFGPTYVAHIPPLEGWYSRDSLCYDGVGARVVYITAKCKKKRKKLYTKRVSSWKIPDARLHTTETEIAVYFPRK